jgi:two-component system CheB/CheR fusion protein
MASHPGAPFSVVRSSTLPVFKPSWAFNRGLFHYALNPSGFLMIGSTEGLLGAGSELFNMVDKKHKIYNKKAGPTPLTLGFSLGTPIGDGDPSEKRAAPDKQTEATTTPLELQRETDRLLVATYAPPAVVVNDSLEIEHIRGRTGDFLELTHGKATLQLLKLARPGLLFELQRAIEEVRNTQREVRKSDVHVENDGRTVVTSIRVLPFTERSGQNHYLVAFEPLAPETRPISEPALTGPLSDEERRLKDAQVEQLRQELRATKEYLQAIIEGQEATNEELQSANEEIQSGNEELQSTNEELQTSKEELESANEELHTVNDEMSHRNELLAQANNDLNKLLNNVDLPMLMVGSDLRVRRFTTQAGIYLGLVSSDIGRPIPRLKLTLDVAQLEQMMLDVMRDVQTKQFDSSDKIGNACRLRVTPYRTLDNRIDGAVLSVVEVTESGQAGKELRSNSKDGTRRKFSTSKSKKHSRNK